MIHTSLIGASILLSLLLCLIAFSGIKFYTMFTQNVKDGRNLKAVVILITLLLIGCLIGSIIFVAA